MIKKQNKKDDTSKQEDVFLKEIKEEAYKDELKKLFKKYNKPIIIIISIIVVLVLFSSINSSRRITKEKKYSKQLYEAVLNVKQHQYKEAQLSLEEALKSNVPETTKSLIELKLAQIHNLQGNYDSSLEIFNRVRNNRRYDSFVREFAGLSALNIMINNHSQVGDKKITKLIKELEQSREGSLKYLVSEQEALYMRIKGDLKTSNAIIEKMIKDKKTPHTVKLRVMEVREINKFIESQKK